MRTTLPVVGSAYAFLPATSVLFFFDILKSAFVLFFLSMFKHPRYKPMVLDEFVYLKFLSYLHCQYLLLDFRFVTIN